MLRAYQTKTTQIAPLASSIGHQGPIASMPFDRPKV